MAGQHQRLGTVEGKRRRGRPRKMWLDNITDWTRLSVDNSQPPGQLSTGVIGERLGLQHPFVHFNDHFDQRIDDGDKTSRQHDIRAFKFIVTVKYIPLLLLFTCLHPEYKCSLQLITHYYKYKIYSKSIRK